MDINNKLDQATKLLSEGRLDSSLKILFEVTQQKFPNEHNWLFIIKTRYSLFKIAKHLGAIENNTEEIKIASSIYDIIKLVKENSHSPAKKVEHKESIGTGNKLLILITGILLSLTIINYCFQNSHGELDDTELLNNKIVSQIKNMKQKCIALNLKTPDIIKDTLNLEELSGFPTNISDKMKCNIKTATDLLKNIIVSNYYITRIISIVESNTVDTRTKLNLISYLRYDVFKTELDFDIYTNQSPKTYNKFLYLNLLKESNITNTKISLEDSIYHVKFNGMRNTESNDSFKFSVDTKRDYQEVKNNFETKKYIIHQKIFYKISLDKSGLYQISVDHSNLQYKECIDSASYVKDKIQNPNRNNRILNKNKISAWTKLGLH